MILSLPSRERGLKYIKLNDETTVEQVAPFAGAWIEIIGVKSSFYGNYVAPFAGAWIEILSKSD